MEKSLDEVLEGEHLRSDKSCIFPEVVTWRRASFEVTEVGMSTEVGKIAPDFENASEKQTPLQKNLMILQEAVYYNLYFAGILFAISVIRGESIVNAFLFAVALAVAAIPEAFSSMTIVLSFGTQKMAKEHAIIRSFRRLKDLAVSIICSDKTGTLTQNKMTGKLLCKWREVRSEEIDLKIRHSESY